MNLMCFEINNHANVCSNFNARETHFIGRLFDLYFIKRFLSKGHHTALFCGQFSKRLIKMFLFEQR